VKFFGRDFHNLNIDATEIATYRNRICPDSETPLLELAQGIASSSLWSSMPDSAILVRRDPSAIAVLGSYNDEESACLNALAWHVDYALRHLRYVDYPQAVEDCRELAARLRERLGDEKIRTCSFTALPRGGLIVLGILSYIMGISPGQLQYPGSPDVPIVVVDDCAISGERFSAFMESCGQREVIFAPLYSHPELRAAVGRLGLPITGCISARDLGDYSDEVDGGTETYRKTWSGRFGDDRLWIGLPEYLCFSWNEPDRPFWNPVTEMTECGWTLLPPWRCLKNMPPRIAVYIQPDAKGPLLPSKEVIFAVIGEEVVVGHTVSHESYVLRGVSAAIWNAVVKFGDRGQVITALADEYDADKQVLQAEVTDFIDLLLQKRIFEENGNGS
jgi:hypothetical protein